METHVRVKRFRLSRTKTEYMMCDFSASRHEGGDISLDGQIGRASCRERVFVGV